MSQWENLIIEKDPSRFSFNYCEGDFLNEQGKRGWNLVSVVRKEITGQIGKSFVNVYYFNRPKIVTKKEP